MAATVTTPHENDTLVESGYLPINAERIERALNDIWQQTTEAHPEHQSPVKLCLANLILVTDAHKRHEAEILSDQLARLEPSRIMLIVIDEDLRTHGAFVRTACTYNRDSESVFCWEIVEMLSSVEGAIHVPSALRALIVGSVPVVAVDYRDFQSTPQLDRALVNMSTYYFLNADLIPTTDTHSHFLPLSWYKTSAIRYLLSRLFSALAQTDHSSFPDRISIAVSDNSVRTHLAGWLISRMLDSGWTLQEDSRLLSLNGHDITLELNRSPSDSPLLHFHFVDGREASVRLTAGEWDTNDNPRVFTADGPILQRSIEAVDLPLGVYINRATKHRSEFQEYAFAQRTIKVWPALIN